MAFSSITIKADIRIEARCCLSWIMKVCKTAVAWGRHQFYPKGDFCPQGFQLSKTHLWFHLLLGYVTLLDLLQRIRGSLWMPGASLSSSENLLIILCCSIWGKCYLFWVFTSMTLDPVGVQTFPLGSLAVRRGLVLLTAIWLTRGVLHPWTQFSFSPVIPSSPQQLSISWVLVLYTKE